MTHASRVRSETAVGGAIAAARQVWFAGLGTAISAAAGARLVFRAMAEEGEKFARRERPEVERALVAVSDQLKSVGEQVELAVEETCSAGLRRFGVPTRQEVRKLASRIEQLTARLEALGPYSRFSTSVDEALDQKPN